MVVVVVGVVGGEGGGWGGGWGRGGGGGMWRATGASPLCFPLDGPRGGEGPGGALFVEGERLPALCAPAAAVLAELADRRCVPWSRLAELGVPAAAPDSPEEAECAELLLALLERGHLFLPTDVEEEEGEEEEEDERVEVVDL